MKLNAMRKMANEKGFTLIELMIVIAIIGILAAVAIPNYISFRDKAFCSGAESDVNSILGTLADYYAIPSHVGGIDSGGAVGPAAFVVGGLSFKALTGTNTALIVYDANTGETTVTVTEASKRCPDDYQTSQANAGWSAADDTFTKTM